MKAGIQRGEWQAGAGVCEKRSKGKQPHRGGGGGGDATELAAVRSSTQDSMAEAELLILHDDGHLARRGTQDDTNMVMACAKHPLVSGGSYPTFAPISWIFFAYCRNLGGNLL